MKSILYSACVGVAASVALVACAMPQKPAYNLYELQPTAPARVDNDAYYVPPKVNHCTYSLSDAPSCGGI